MKRRPRKLPRKPAVAKRPRGTGNAGPTAPESDADVWRRDRRPPFRRLRAYALDPGAATAMDTALINEVVFRVRWEDVLAPGPVGVVPEREAVVGLVGLHPFDDGGREQRPEQPTPGEDVGRVDLERD